MINVQIHFDFTDQIDKKRIEKFEVDLNIEPGISFINGSIKKWHKFKRRYDLPQNSYFQWVQLIDSIPEK